MAKVKITPSDDEILMNPENNDGSVMMGRIKVPYGKDNSLYAGSVDEEQIHEIGGGTDNLSHTIMGAKAAASKQDS